MSFVKLNFKTMKENNNSKKNNLLKNTAILGSVGLVGGFGGRHLFKRYKNHLAQQEIPKIKIEKPKPSHNLGSYYANKKRLEESKERYNEYKDSIRQYYGLKRKLKQDKSNINSKQFKKSVQSYAFENKKKYQKPGGGFYFPDPNKLSKSEIKNVKEYMSKNGEFYYDENISPNFNLGSLRNVFKYYRDV